MILASIEFNKSINSKEFDKSYLALSKILHSDMRDFFQTDFGKEYYQKWLKNMVRISLNILNMIMKKMKTNKSAQDQLLGGFSVMALLLNGIFNAKPP